MSKVGWVQDSSCASGWSRSGICWSGDKGGSSSGGSSGDKGGDWGSKDGTKDGTASDSACAAHAVQSQTSEHKNSTQCGGADALSGLPAPQRCLTHANATRCWYEYVPTPSPTQPVPLLLDLHGYGGCGHYEACSSGWRQLAARDGGLVVWPVGLPDSSGTNVWGAMGNASDSTDKHAVDDVGFLSALVESVLTRHAAAVDAARVYAVGFSNGCVPPQPSPQPCARSPLHAAYMKPARGRFTPPQPSPQPCARSPLHAAYMKPARGRFTPPQPSPQPPVLVRHSAAADR
jgi:hypothetical protein